MFKTYFKLDVNFYLNFNSLTVNLKWTYCEASHLKCRPAVLFEIVYKKGACSRLNKFGLFLVQFYLLNLHIIWRVNMHDPTIT